MGLTNKSVGYGAIDSGLEIIKHSSNDKIIALAGNPNVGKSTIFNALTGMRQHTGNWPGKTVANAQGYFETANNSYVLVDIPGTYSLMPHSAEEEIARNFICFGSPDATVVVCDATCLERNLNLVLQVIEISPQTVVCVNLLDEAKRKEITIDLNKLSELLGVAVVGVIAQKKKTLFSFKKAMDEIIDKKPQTAIKVVYPDCIETAIKVIEEAISSQLTVKINPRWIAIKLLDYDESLINEINYYCGKNILENEAITASVSKAIEFLKNNGIEKDQIKDIIISTLVRNAESIAKKVVSYKKAQYNSFDRRMDRILTSKFFGYPLMLLLLAIVLWLTISAANYPSSLLSSFFDFIGEHISGFILNLGFPPWLHSLLIDGVYRVLTWVVAVMLPPMAVFFPLFTLLEDIGYLPRIAYNLDKPFKRCNACGKQALTM